MNTSLSRCKKATKFIANMAESLEIVRRPMVRASSIPQIGRVGHAMVSGYLTAAESQLRSRILPVPPVLCHDHTGIFVFSVRHGNVGRRLE